MNKNSTGSQLIDRPSITLATCVYGSGFEPLIITFLETWSIYTDDIVVLCEDLAPETLSQLRQAYPNVEFIQADIGTDGPGYVRISQKVLYWLELVEKCRGDAPDFLILADIDTMAVKPIEGLCCGDIVITRRSPGSQFFLNSGVVCLSQRAIFSDFMSEWAAATASTMTCKKTLAIAIDPTEPFGGRDQYALMSVLTAGMPKTPLPDSFKGLSLVQVSCHEYNACENVIKPEIARILHLKASLQYFLLRRRPLIGERQATDAHYQLRTALLASKSGLKKLESKGINIQRYRFRLPLLTRADMTVPSPILYGYRVYFRLLRHIASWRDTALRSIGKSH